MSHKTETQPRWVVPYTAPGIIRGHLIVRASSREDAINAAIEIHARRSTNTVTGNPSWRLKAAERAGITYGEPAQIAEAVVPEIEQAAGAAIDRARAAS